jgi:hypothetical protein
MTNSSARRDPEKPGPIAIETAYNALVISRNAELGSRWNAAQVGIILNAPALGGALVGLFQRPALRELYMLAFGSGIPILLNFFWRGMLRRNGVFLEFWNGTLAQIEELHKIEGGIRVFSSAQYLDMRNRGLRFNTLLQWVAIISTVLWAAIAGGAVAWMFVLAQNP